MTPSKFFPNCSPPDHRRVNHRVITTNYVNPAMRAPDGATNEKGVVVIMNEVGLDPEIDHCLYAVQTIGEVQVKGDKVRFPSI